MNKFFKGEKVIIVDKPTNQQSVNTRLGTIVNVKEKNSIDILYDVQVMEFNSDFKLKYAGVLYNLPENSFIRYSELANILFT